MITEKDKVIKKFRLLSESGLNEFKESIKSYYGLSDEDLNIILKGGLES